MSTTKYLVVLGIVAVIIMVTTVYYMQQLPIQEAIRVILLID